MTSNIQKIISQCDDIDSMPDATIFSISGTKPQALAQLAELENTLDLVNCSITYIEDDSTGFEEDYAAYSVSTNLSMMKFNQLITTPNHISKEATISKSKLNQNEKLAASIVKKLIENPFSYLSKQNISLDDFNDEPMISYHIKDKFVVIHSDEEGFFIVAVSDENGKKIVTGFSEKLSILTYMMYEDLLLEKSSSDDKIKLNDAA